MNAPQRPSVLSALQRRFLRKLAALIVPETEGASASVADAMISAVDDQLRPRPRLQQLEFKLLLLGLGWMTLLPRGWRVWLLHRLENFPLRLVRVGLWGLKTLIYLGYYGQEPIQQRIRYSPSRLEGNVRLRAHQLPSEG